MTELTARAVAFALSEEGMVLEAYKDSVGVWTWAGGVTNASGHQVHPRYLDQPQTLESALTVTIWLMRQKYLPTVLRAFEGCNLTDGQLAAALSFHWNTGAIGNSSWVRDFKAGHNTAALTFLTTHYLNNGTLKDRRLREAALFFDGVWPVMLCPIYPVRKPSYTPNWGKADRRDLLPMIEQVMAA